MVGTMGTYGFYGRKSPYTHSLRYGKKWVQGVMLQWQNGEQVCVWPRKECPNPLKFPSFLKIAATAK